MDFDVRLFREQISALKPVKGKNLSDECVNTVFGEMTCGGEPSTREVKQMVKVLADHGYHPNPDGPGYINTTDF